MAEGFSVLDLEKRIIQLCEKYPYGITEELLAIDMPDVLPLQRAAALHRLLSLRCIKKIKMTPPLLFRLKEADKPRKDTADSDDDGGQPGERHRKRKRIKEGKLSKKSLGLTAKQQLRVTSKATISTSDDSDSEQETKPKKSRSSSDVPDKEARSQRIQSDSSSDAGQRKSRSPSKSGSGDVSSRGSSSSGSESEQNAKPKRRHISDSESHEVKRDTSSEHDKSHSDNEKQNSGSDDEKRNSGSSGSQSE